MAKLSWSTGLSATGRMTGAEMEAMFTEIHNAFIGCGLLQTEDTGQLATFEGLATPSSNLNYGFRVYELADSLRATNPVFIRVSFMALYANSSYYSGAFSFNVGSQTDGAGGIIGSVGSYSPFTSGSVTATTPGPYPSFACGGEGFFWLAFKVGFKPGQQSSNYVGVKSGQRSSLLWLAIFRETDVHGSPNGNSISFLRPTDRDSTASVGELPLHSGCYISANPLGVVHGSEWVCSPIFMDSVNAFAGKALVSNVYSKGLDGIYATPYMGAISQGLCPVGDIVPAALVGSDVKNYISIGDTATLSTTRSGKQQVTTPIFIWED